MTPTPPSPEDDILDLDGLGGPAQKPKASTQESDFEKELEALFAEDLAQAEAAAAAKKPAAAPVSAGGDEEALLLQDLLGDDAPVAPAPIQQPVVDEDALDLSAFADAAPAAAAGGDEDVLDLSAFGAAESSDAGDADALDLSAFAAAEPSGAGDEDALDLSAFAADGPLDLTPPADSAGGKDGGIDIEGLDSLISELGEGPQAPAAAAQPQPDLLPELPEDGPLDGIDIHGLDDILDVPKAASVATPAADDEDALDLNLGDLLDEPVADAPVATDAPDASGLGDDLLDLTLPDISEPEPGAVLDALDDTPAPELPDAEALAAAALAMAEEDLVPGLDLGAEAVAEPVEPMAEPVAELAPEPVIEPMAEPVADMGLGDDLELSLHGELPADLSADLAAESDLGIGSLEAAGLAEAMEGFDAHMPEVVSEVPLDAGTVLEQAHAEAVLGAVAGAAAAGAVAAAVAQPASAAEPVSAAATQVILTPEVLAEMQKMLTELRHQVLGGSVTVVGMQGQLAEKEQIIATMEERLRLAEEEAAALREELSALRSVLEEDGKTSTQVKERLALLEDRQAQMDQDMRAEIERAVPREAAKVIREEIAALAESMND